jgi:hypothetical protein
MHDAQALRAGVGEAGQCQLRQRNSTAQKKHANGFHHFTPPKNGDL